MSKVLSIAVCAYNVEAYIEKALDSCIVPNMEYLEVLIMNDGSSDRTAEITQGYCDKYPDVFKLINKENGGWGSNLNMAVQIAEGKYFREMDADDWYDSEGLEKCINILRQIDVDMVLSKHRRVYMDEENIVKEYVVNPDWKGKENKQVNIKDVDPFRILIWNATFSTELLRDGYIDLPHKSLYTDTLFVLYALPKVKTVYFQDQAIYNYRIGRDGQSVSPDSVRKHYKEILNVTHLGMCFVEERLQTSEIANHLSFKIEDIYLDFLGYLILPYGAADYDCKTILKTLDEDLKQHLPASYEKTGQIKRWNWLRKTNYMSILISYIKRKI